AVAGDVQIAGPVLEARGDRPVRVDFSEGSAIILTPGVRVAIVETDARGARLRVDEGRAHVAVTHRLGARWSVAAGPYTVRVIGTEFDIAWSPTPQTLEVALGA